MQPVFAGVTPCAAPLIPISSCAPHGSQALCISRLYEVHMYFTGHPHSWLSASPVGFLWAPPPLTITRLPSPAFVSSATMALAPMATYNYLPADNCSAAALPPSSPFKATLWHQGSFYSGPPELGGAEQSRKGKQLNRRGFAKL